MQPQPGGRSARALPGLGGLTLRVKLGLMMLVPLVALGVFATGAVMDKLADRAAAVEMRHRAELALAVGELVHELQLERGRSGLALGGGGVTADLIEQRSRADEAYAAFALQATAFGAGVDERFDQSRLSVDARWGGLAAHRRAIDAGSLGIAQAFRPYSSLIELLLDLTTYAGTVDSSRSSVALSTAHWDFLHATERAALTRGVLGAAAATGELTPQQRREVEALLVEEQVHLHSFVDRAPEDTVARYREVLHTDEVRTALDLRGELVSGYLLASAPDSGRIFEALSGHVDALMTIQREMIEEIVAEADGREEAATVTLGVIGGGAVLLIVACFGVLWIGARSIARPLRSLAAGARRIAEGDIEPEHSEWANDAIGEIGQAFDDMRDYLAEMAAVAEDLAWGKLDTEVEPRSPQDTFGKSLAAMTRRLSMTMAESEERATELERTVDRLRASERELWRAATHDPLTGLPNRAHFMDRFGEELDRARRLGHRLAVAFIDLDRFKQVNDTLGHEAGDELLKHVADRMQRQLRPTDGVARLGGDEFAVLLRDVNSGDDTITVLDRLVASLSEPYELDWEIRDCPPSIGVALFPDDGQSPDALLACADGAMYASKRAGGGIYRYHAKLGDEHRIAG